MIVFDIETDGLDLSKIQNIWVIGTLDTETLEERAFRKPEEAIEYLKGKTLVGHNILKYDIPVLQKFFPEFKPEKVYDTLLGAKLAWSDILHFDQQEKRIPAALWGSYSLKSFGYRFKFYKGTYGEQEDAWDYFRPEMEEYCMQDVRLTYKLWQFIQKKTPLDVLEMEQEVWRILERQKNYGFLLDEEKALRVYNELQDRSEEILRELRNRIPDKEDVVGYYKKPNKTKGIKAGDPKIRITPFNPNSGAQIAKYFIEKYKWKPTEKTKGGSPSTSEDVLAKLPYPEAKLILEYKMLTKMKGFIHDGTNGWLKVSDDNGRIHGSVDGLGTVTGRMTHSNPNMGQIPRGGELGHTMRSMFIAPPGRKIVGCDASGLELRCLAHYMGDPEYTELILHGDIHTHNQKAAGLPTRDQAKTFVYALIYGGGNGALGQLLFPEELDLEKSKKAAGKVRRQFYREIPKIKELGDRVAHEAASGRIQNIDGRSNIVKKDYAALNVLLQGTGAIAMKKALVILDADLKQKYTPGIDYEFVANVHDEWQIECDESIAKDVGETMRRAIQKAGDALGFKCPLDGEYKIGDSWAETH